MRETQAVPNIDEISSDHQPSDSKHKDRGKNRQQSAKIKGTKSTKNVQSYLR